MTQFLTPKLLIVDYYDSLIADIDIYTEELLEKYTDEDRLPNVNKNRLEDSYQYDIANSDFFELDSIIDPYKEEYKNDFDNQLIKVIPGETKVRDYLNLVRSRAIEEINKCREENLEQYEMNKEKYKYNRNELTDEKVEEMRKKLFRDKFCFVINIEEFFKGKCANFFKRVTIITDFYLDSETRRKSLKVFDMEKCKLKFVDFNQNDFLPILLHLLSKCIYDLLNTQIYGFEVISLSKETLFNVKRLKSVEYQNIQDLNVSHLFDISNFKSLGIYTKNELVSRQLNPFTNLEYLYIYGAIIDPEAFACLNRLIKLDLSKCHVKKPSDQEHQESKSSKETKKIYPLDSTFLSKLTNLQVLELNWLEFPIDLECLHNLKVLILHGVMNFDYIVNIGKITGLAISHIIRLNRRRENRFFRPKNVPFVTHLRLSVGFEFDPHWLHAFTGLKRLSLSGNYVGESLSFLESESLSQLVYLSLRDSSISRIKEGVFAKLKSLRYLDLSHNRIDLEFDLSDSTTESRRLFSCFKKPLNKYISKKDVFFGLDNLEILDLSENRIRYIDPEVFTNTPMLAHLKLRRNMCRLEEDTFTKLKNLKKIDLSNLGFDSNVLNALKRSNIEICIF